MTYFGDQVERVKQQTDLVRLFSRYTPVQRTGSTFSACCPFHNERTPSLVIYPEDGTFHCFGCGAHGDAVSLIREKERVEFHQAVEILAQEAGITLEDRAKPADPAVVELSDRLLHAMAFALDFYCTAFTQAEAAQTYLTSRGLKPEVAQRHQLGWAAGGQTLLTAARKAGFADEDLIAAGLAKRKDGKPLRDFFWHRIMVPIFDNRGRPIAFTARALPNDLAQMKAQGYTIGKWVNTPATAIYDKGTTVYNLSRAKSAAKAWASTQDRRRLLVCEGALDVLALDQAGHAEACAPCGTAITADQAKAIAEAAAGRVEVFLVLDGDAAGDKGADRGVRELLAAGAAVRVAQLPPGLDPAELLIEQPTDDHKQAWTDLLASAKPAVPWLTDRMCPVDQRIDEAARLRAFDELVEILERCPDDALRELYLTGVSRTLRLPASLAKQRAARRWAEAQASKSAGASVPDLPGNASEGARGSSEIDLLYPLNEQGNAIRFADKHGLDVRYVHTWGVWIVWRESHWEIDRTREVERRMLSAIAQTCSDEIDALETRLSTTIVVVMQERIRDAIDDLKKWAVKNANDRAVMNSLNRAAALEILGCESDHLDADPWAFTVQNGTLDLRSGELREHKRDDWITRLCDVEYNPSAWCDRWATFIEEFAGEDAELVAYIKRAIGYGMTGVTKEDAVWIWSGPGGNGKGTLVAACQRMLGSYARSLPFEIFLLSNSDKRKWSLAETSQSRLVVCEESEEGKKFNSSLVKLVSGGTPIEAERKHGQPFVFLPKFKVWFISNNLPTVSDTDRGFWRRLHHVRCEHLPAQVDRDLREYFQNSPEARQAILTWAIEGAKDYAANGLQPPKAVLEANASYRDDQDPLKDFLAESCVIDPDDQGATLAVREFRSVYRKWCDENGVKYPLSDRAIAQRLSDRDVDAGGCYVRIRLDNGIQKSVRGYRGIRWRSPEDDLKTSPRLSDSSEATSGAGSQLTLDQASDANEAYVIVDDSTDAGLHSAPHSKPAPLSPRLETTSGTVATQTQPIGSDEPASLPRLDPVHTHEEGPSSFSSLSRRERNPNPSDAPPDSRTRRLSEQPRDDEDIFGRPHRPDGTRTSDPDPDEPEPPEPTP